MIKKTYIVFILLYINILMPANLSAQTIGFTKTHGISPFYDSFTDIEFSDTSFILTGYIRRNHVLFAFADSAKILLVEYDNNGNIIRENSYIDTAVNLATHITKLTNDKYLITGFTLTPSTYQIRLINTDNKGDMLWTSSVPLDFSDVAISAQSVQLSDSNFITLGGALYSVFLRKTNQNGDIIWTKKYIDADGRRENATSLIQISDTALFITVWSSDSVTANMDSISILKTDTSGSKLLSKNLAVNDTFTAPKATTALANNIIIGGNTVLDGLNRGHLFLLNIDLSAVKVWEKVYPSLGYQGMNDLVKTRDNGYAFVSTGDDSIYLVKTDSMGNIEWIFGYREDSMYYTPNTLAMINDSTYIVAGDVMDDTDTVDHRDAFVMKINMFEDTISWIRKITNNTPAIYPNPAYNDVFIKHNSPIQKVEVFSIQGKIVLKQDYFNFRDDKAKINLQHLKPGIYLLRISMRHGTYTRKVVKK